ncbi:hypothetical protein BDV18DRAFT_101337 [Aspergillus unguis]
MLPTLVMVLRLWNGELEFICACFFFLFGCLLLHCLFCIFGMSHLILDFVFSEYMSTASSPSPSHLGWPAWLSPVRSMMAEAFRHR